VHKQGGKETGIGNVSGNFIGSVRGNVERFWVVFVHSAMAWSVVALGIAYLLSGKGCAALLWCLAFSVWVADGIALRAYLEHKKSFVTIHDSEYHKIYL
jgi:hypothetical protein